MMNEMQNRAFCAIQLGKNVMITGAAGTGKTFIIQAFHEWAKTIDSLHVAVTSTTGVSALLIGGTTIHSWAGVGLGEDSAMTLAKKIKNIKRYNERWMTTSALIIDEVSMLPPDLFDKLDQIGRIVRNVNRPFGGIQLIVMGDFCQLNPVKSDSYCFEAKCWKQAIDRVYHLTEIIRQKDKTFQQTLNNIRMGIVTAADKALLNTRVNQKVDDLRIKPTKLFSLKKDVERTNKIALETLKSAGNLSRIYKARISLENKHSSGSLTDSQQTRFINAIQGQCQAVNALELAVGSQVMLICNLDLTRGFANGTRGVVTDLTDNGPMVYFRNGCEELIEPWKWVIHFADEHVDVAKHQIPLILADACTIHKSQGSTIDYLEVNLGSSIWECGQTYTALSRVRTLDGLFITSIDYSKILVHPKVHEFYRTLNSVQ